MKNRTLPYGYCCENGVIAVQPQESDVLKQIYAAYLNGQSLLTIAEKLNQDGTEYMPKVIAWNKGRIKRLIEDKRYLGTDIFPSLIAKETFVAAQKVKQDRNTQKDTDRSQEIFKLTVPVVCPSCDGRMRRRHDSRCKCQERWTCENKDCRLLIEIADAELLEALAALLGTATPDGTEYHAAAYEPSDKVRSLNNEISRMLDAPEIDKAALRSKITECLAQKYSELGNECCTAQRLKAELSNPSGDIGRLNRTVREIRLHTDKTADILLLNGQIIGKEKDDGTNRNDSTASGASDRADRIG